MRYSVIIPAYNEALTIEEALRQTTQSLSALGESYEVIVVDDGSNDTTSEGVKNLQHINPSLPIVLIRQTKNQGKGAAIKAGVAIAHGENIAFLDADLATHPDELKTAFSLLKDSDIAIASRRHPEARIAKPQPRYRSWLGQVFNQSLRLYLDLPYRDTQCGCKAFRTQVAKTLFAELKTTGWAFDVELLVRARLHNYTVSEFPITWRNGNITRVRIRHAFKIVQDLIYIKGLKDSDS